MDGLKRILSFFSFVVKIFLEKNFCENLCNLWETNTFAKILSLKKFKDTLKLIFPSNLVEWILFVIFLTSYGILGSYIALNYRIIFDDRIPWDAYFSFDNRSIVMTGGGFERHPLSNYFFDFIREFALWISDGKKNEIFLWFWLGVAILQWVWLWFNYSNI